MLANQNDEDWEQVRSMFANATKTPRALAKTRRARANTLDCHIVLVRQPRCYRHDLNILGRRARGHYSNKQARTHREPWVLATSLPVERRRDCQHIVDCYATRMQIEAACRDIKSERFGLAYRARQSKRLDRIEMLLLVAHIAQIVAWLLALRVVVAGLQARYQANTVRHRVVLSMVYLGRRVWRDPPDDIPFDSGRLLINDLRQLVQQHAI